MRGGTPRALPKRFTWMNKGLVKNKKGTVLKAIFAWRRIIRQEIQSDLKYFPVR